MTTQFIGKPILRTEGREKVTGQAEYVDDMSLPGMLHGITVRSPVPRGRLQAIRFPAGIQWDEITIVTARDVPGKNYVALIENDQPCLAAEAINHAEEAVVLLAHADKHLLEEARRAVELEIEPLPAIFTIDESLSRKDVIYGKDNVFRSFEVQKGDIESAWSHADLIVEGEYETGEQEQLYIEPQGMIAIFDPEAGLTVWGSMQCPYYVHRALMTLLNLPVNKVRVIQTETGGGFGGKEEYPSIIAGHAALLAWKSGKPVKIVYDRMEDMAATTKRHPSRTHHRTAVLRDGKLLAMDIDFIIDGGAYTTLSPVVLSRGTIHAAGPYFCPNVRIRSRAVATNHPPHGAFRGFGAPQSIFALERHMDAVANAVGLTADELRRRNFVRPGETLAVGQMVRENVDMARLMDRAFQLSDYYEKRRRFAEENPKRNIKKGIGFASFLHGAGFTGSGERYLASLVTAEATAEGRVRVLTAATEMGQGTKTMFSQIAAEALGIDLEMIEIVQPDTSIVPNSGPTVASRTCMVVGKLVESAVLGIRQQLFSSSLLPQKYTSEDFRDGCRKFIELNRTLKTTTEYKAPPGIYWDDREYSGDAYAAYAWAVYVAEVSVDVTTYEVRVDDFIAVQEIGRVINPVLATGQIEGGVAQGVGYALYENVVWQEGRMVNSQMTNYIMPTSADVPNIRVFFEEIPYAYGPGGAKGIGELPIDGPAPAIVNAVENATAIKVKRIPLTPEVLMEAMEAVHA